MKPLFNLILGSITILDSSFDGFQQIYDNFTFGPRYPAMDPSRLVALSSLKEVTGFLNIQAHHPNFTSLDAFRNLVRKSSNLLIKNLYIPSTINNEKSMLKVAMRAKKKFSQS